MTLVLKLVCLVHMHVLTDSFTAGLEMDQIICGCCHTLLMYSRGAASVRCLCCHTVNLTSSNPPPGTKYYNMYEIWMVPS